MNQIFGYQLIPEDRDAASVVFEGAFSAKIPALPQAVPRQVDVVAFPNTHLQTHYSHRTGALTYLWGIPSHPTIIQSEIAGWCSDVIAEERYGSLKDLLGHFAVVIDEPRQRRVTFVADLLGVRPMFIGCSKGRLIFGSEVWPVQKAGLVNGDVNYDAVSAWLAYRYNCTDGSIFNELHRLAPGSVTVFQDGHFKTTPYVQWQSNDNLLTEDKVAADLHGIVSSTVEVILRNHPQVMLALSGGYDSRYLLALSSAILKQPIQCTTVAIRGHEDTVARQVAETVGASQRRMPVKGSEWDLYQEVFHAAPDGFPISKNLTYLVAQDYAGIPMLHGFLGGALMRGANDTYLGKYETEWKEKESLAHILQRKHLAVSFEVFRSETAKRIQERSLIPMEAAVRKGSEIDKIFGWANLYYRNRLYIANNFHQSLGLTEALIPFYSWQLLSYKMSHDYKCFSRNVYRKIFEQHFPDLATIPHADELPKRGVRQTSIATCAQTWARQLFPSISRRSCLGLLSRKHCLPRMLAGMAGMSRAEGLLLTVQRLYCLEKLMKDARLSFDWERM